MPDKNSYKVEISTMIEVGLGAAGVQRKTKLQLICGSGETSFRRWHWRRNMKMWNSDRDKGSEGIPE